MLFLCLFSNCIVFEFEIEQTLFTLKMKWCRVKLHLNKKPVLLGCHLFLRWMHLYCISTRWSQHFLNSVGIHYWFDNRTSSRVDLKLSTFCLIWNLSIFTEKPRSGLTQFKIVWSISDQNQSQNRTSHSLLLSYFYKV